MSVRLEELHQAGFWVFGGHELCRLEGGVGSPSPFPVAILQVLKADNPEIIKVDLARVTEQGAERPPDAPAAASDASDV